MENTAIYKTMTHDQIKAINLKCVQLKAELMTLGLFETARKMDEVTRKVGWETAAIIEGKHPVKLDVQ